MLISILNVWLESKKVTRQYSLEDIANVTVIFMEQFYTYDHIDSLYQTIDKLIRNFKRDGLPKTLV